MWLVQVEAGYAALTVWIASLSRAFRQKQTSVIVALLLLPPVLLALGMVIPTSARFLVGCALLVGLSLLAVRLLAPHDPLMPARDCNGRIELGGWARTS